MALAIWFGKIQIEYDENKPYLSHAWPDFSKENDGTSQEYTESSGWHYRDIYYSRVDDWINSVEEVKAFFEAVEGYSSNSRMFFLNKNMMELINSIPETNNPFYADRAKWLKYWAKRAKEQFGDDAIIAFS